MRDPERIDKMLNKLGELWKRSPDLRLGQLIANLNILSGYGSDCFFIEDDKLLNMIEGQLLELNFSHKENQCNRCCTCENVVGVGMYDKATNKFLYFTYMCKDCIAMINELSDGYAKEVGDNNE